MRLVYTSGMALFSRSAGPLARPRIRVQSAASPNVFCACLALLVLVDRVENSVCVCLFLLCFHCLHIALSRIRNLL